jgi:hypothetical protein
MNSGLIFEKSLISILNNHLINNLWANFGERIELCDCIKTRGKNKRIYMIKGNDKETKR